MALTWVIANVVGDGTAPRPGQTETTGPFRPAAADLLAAHRSLIMPGIARCLVLSEADPAVLAADGRLDVLPADRLDAVIPANRVNQTNNALGRHGFTTVCQSGWTWRELILALAHEIEPTFTFGWWPGSEA
jgi:hypothetical protein